MVIDVFTYLSVVLLSGMWWVMPHLALTNREVRQLFLRGELAKEIRVAFKVRGACIRWKMATEARAVRKCLVEHLRLILPSTTSKTLCIALENQAHKTYMAGRKDPVWTYRMRRCFSLGTMFFHNNMFHLVQLGVILMHYGMGDTWVFRMLETQVDLLMHSVRSVYRFVYPRGLHINYRKVVKAVLSSRHHFCFLYSMDVRSSFAFHGITEFGRFVNVMRLTSRVQEDRFCARLPPCARGGIALLTLHAHVHKGRTMRAATRHRLDEFHTYCTRGPGFDQQQDVIVVM